MAHRSPRPLPHSGTEIRKNGRARQTKTLNLILFLHIRKQKVKVGALWSTVMVTAPKHPLEESCDVMCGKCKSALKRVLGAQSRGPFVIRIDSGSTVVLYLLG